MSEWRTIDSAPRDGTAILVYFPDGLKGPWGNDSRDWFPECVGVARWSGRFRKNGERNWDCTDRWETPLTDYQTYGGSEMTGSWTEEETCWCEPTHWMPYPEPPQP